LGDPDSPLRLAYLDAQLVQRVGQAADVASAAVYLASDEATFVTGANLVIDGGYTVGGGVGRPITGDAGTAALDDFTFN
jgi:NAD(P)-dependent dehydrogenase (short-subunit alcohol dehydrogenase family)